MSVLAKFSFCFVAMLLLMAGASGSYDCFYDPETGDYDLCDAQEFTLAVLKHAKEFLGEEDGRFSERWYALSEATNSYEMDEVAEGGKNLYLQRVFDRKMPAGSTIAPYAFLTQEVPCGAVRIRYEDARESGDIVDTIGISIGGYEQQEGWCDGKEAALPPIAPLDYAFLISDEHWQDVMELIPVAVYTEDGVVHSAPVLIYHLERRAERVGEAAAVKTYFDADSIIHFLQQYEPGKLYVVEHTPGDTPRELEDVLYLDPEEDEAGMGPLLRKEQYVEKERAAAFGGIVEKDKVVRITPRDYYDSELFPHWNSEGAMKEAVLVNDDDYEGALMAAVYASYRHAPLLVANPSAIGNDPAVKNKYDIFLYGKTVTIVEDGDSLKSLFDYYDDALTLPELQKEYVGLTGTGRVIMTNPADIYASLALTPQPWAPYNVLWPERGGGSIRRYYYKTSMSAPVLAAAKHELIITVHSEDYVEADEEFTRQLLELYDVSMEMPGYGPPYTYSCDQKDESCFKGYKEEVVKEMEIEVQRGRDGRFEATCPLEENKMSFLKLMTRENDEAYIFDKYTLTVVGNVYCDGSFNGPVLRVNDVNMYTWSSSSTVFGGDYIREYYASSEGVPCSPRGGEKMMEYRFTYEWFPEYAYFRGYGDGKLYVELIFEAEGDLDIQVAGLGLEVQRTHMEKEDGEKRTDQLGLLACEGENSLEIPLLPNVDDGLSLEECFGKKPETASVSYLLEPEHAISGSEVRLEVRDPGKPHVLYIHGYNDKEDAGEWNVEIYLKRLLEDLRISEDDFYHGGEFHICTGVREGLLNEGEDTLKIVYTGDTALTFYEVTMLEAGMVPDEDEDESPLTERVNYLTILASPPSIGQAETVGEGGCVIAETDNWRYGNILDDKDVDLAVGRIYGITVSDVSALVARSVAFERIKPGRTKALFIMRGLQYDDTKSDIANVYEGKDWWDKRIWEGFDDHYGCYTYEGCDEVRGKILNWYETSQLIIFKGHGGGYGLDGNIRYDDLEQLESPFIFADACATCAFDPIYSFSLFCAQNIRKGALGYYGAIYTVTSSDYISEIMNALYVEDKSIGEGMKNEKNVEKQLPRKIFGLPFGTQPHIVNLYFLLIGDPTLKPKSWQ
jgi:hypothetical protein